FCQAGRDLRLSSLASEPLDVAPGFLLVGAKSPSAPDTLLVCAVDRRFLPDERGLNALLGFSGNCMGCEEKGFRYFTEFSNHINLKLSTQPKKQKHLKYHLYRNSHGQLVRGAAISWKGLAGAPVDPIGHPHLADLPPPLTNGSHTPLSQNPLPQTAVLSNGPGRPTVIGHGSLPQLSGKVCDVQVSSLLQSCYQNSQALPRIYQHYGPSPIQPLSAEMQILLTVPLIQDLEQIFMRSWRESHLSEIRQYQQPQPGLSLPQAPSTLPGLPQAQALTPSQLPWLAQLAASSCGEGVVVLGEKTSMALGLADTFTRLMEGRLAHTNYVVIICTAKGQETESCVVVTDGEVDVLLESAAVESSSQLSPLSSTDSSTQNLDLGSFNRVHFLICVPPSEVTFQQTVLHLWNSDATNILTLHVTSFPFALQTQHTRISPYNEIHWPSTFNNLHSAVIRTQVLVQHYCVALMAVSGRPGSGGRSIHKHTSVETLEIVQSLLSSAQRCPTHHGHMVLLRIPSLALAGWAHQRLAWRTSLEEELGLAAYLVRVESQGSQPHSHAPGPGSDLSESDPDKLSSTDNEEEEGGENALKLEVPGLGHCPPPHPPSAPQPPRPFSDSSGADTLHLHTTPPDPHRSPCPNPNPPNPSDTQRWPSKSTSSDSSSTLPPSPLQSCSWARGVSRPPSVLLPRALYDIITACDGSGLPRCTSFLPHLSVAWASSFRPLLSKMMTCGQLECVQYHPACAPWPITDTLRGMPFDYTIHNPKYEDISTVYCPDYYPNTDGNPRRKEDVYLRRRTARIKLSKYATYNTYHHCEQCHQYMGFNPRYQNPDCIKSPIFTPTTGRHEHGLFNLYHAMDGAAHLHILVIKEYEMSIYKKYWPNHIMLVLPTVFNGAGIGAAHFLIKELSYHNLELERSRRLEGGGPPGNVWPFIIVSDDSCVIASGPVERNVSLKQVLQHMEACPDLTQYGLCGIRKWSSRSPGQGERGGARHEEPFSRGHLHDFLLLNVDLTQDVHPSQYICAPDSKHPFLATPAQLLLEKYLQHTSQRLFPLSARNYTHPILSVDCYLNLGPEVTVCFVSSRPHAINISTAELLQTVVRLELEDEWRFRLSDEFQTANAKEDRPLFFLTGKHI
ncbi:unnamed protein product, partial [Coregonus sp. 'balchen']